MLKRIASRTIQFFRLLQFPYSAFANKTNNNNSTKTPLIESRGKLILPMQVSVPDLSSILGLTEEMVGSIANDVTPGGIPRNKWKDTLLAKNQIEVICAAAEVNYDFKCEQKEKRPPIITVMGHVDHGKTTLIDALRHSNLTAYEYGEITQSIGAFSLLTKNKRYITVIDTPGHEVFVKMRSRGVLATDLIVLVISAAEGVQRQTDEVIKLARDSNVPMIVALNKMDRSDADPERLLLELADRDVNVEDLGGDVPCIMISAKKEQNLDSLVSIIEKKADLLDLEECPQVRPQGFIIESELLKSEKFVSVASSVLIMRGTLTTEHHFVCGRTIGRVRYIRDDTGNYVKRIGPGKAAHVSGFKEIPPPGSLLHVVADSKQAQMIQYVKTRIKAASEKPTRLFAPVGTDDVSKIEDDMNRAIPIIIKVSRAGILETIMDELLAKVRKGKIYILTTGIGVITEADIKMAADTKGVIFGFEVDCRETASGAAAGQGVPIRIHRLLFHLIENLGKLENEVERRQGNTKYQVVTGRATILKVFNLSGNAIVVGGARVNMGKISKTRKCKVIRKGTVVKDGLVISGFKRLSQNIDEAEEGTECGISFENLEDLAQGDIVESYVEVEREPSFSFAPGVQHCD